MGKIKPATGAYVPDEKSHVRGVGTTKNRKKKKESENNRAKKEKKNGLDDMIFPTLVG